MNTQGMQILKELVEACSVHDMPNLPIKTPLSAAKLFLAQAENSGDEKETYAGKFGPQHLHARASKLEEEAVKLFDQQQVHKAHVSMDTARALRMAANVMEDVQAS